MGGEYKAEIVVTPNSLETGEVEQVHTVTLRAQKSGDANISQGFGFKIKVVKSPKIDFYASTIGKKRIRVVPAPLGAWIT